MLKINLTGDKNNNQNNKADDLDNSKISKDQKVHKSSQRFDNSLDRPEPQIDIQEKNLNKTQSYDQNKNQSKTQNKDDPINQKKNDNTEDLKNNDQSQSTANSSDPNKDQSDKNPLDINKYEREKYGHEVPAEEASWVKKQRSEYKKDMKKGKNQSKEDVQLNQELRKDLKKDLDQLLKQVLEEKRQRNQEIRKEVEELAQKKGLKGKEKEKFIEKAMKGTDLSQIFSKSINKELEDLDANEDQKTLFKTSLFMYIQARIDNHLQDVLPDDLFLKLDEMLDENEIDEEEVIGVVMFAYEMVMGQSVMIYSRNLINEVLPIFKDIFKKNQEDMKKILKLSIPKQEEFIKLVDQGKYDDAKKLLN